MTATSTAPWGRSHLLSSAIDRTRRWLLDQQQADGFWVAELQGDTILESEYILLLAWLGRERQPKALKCARYLLEQQLPGGGWNAYPGGPLEISGSVKAYFALKLTGHDPSSEPLQRARAAILAAGGADKVNSFTRFYLAMLGQIDYRNCPAVPPELVLLPRWSPINLAMMSSWTRTIVVPLSILSACQPVTQVPPECGIRELFIRQPEDWPALRPPGAAASERLVSWESFFRLTDRALKMMQRRKLAPLRKRALKAAEKWMLDRFKNSEGLGAIFPPMVWSVIGLRCLGYRDDHPRLQYCYDQLAALEIEEAGVMRLEPCKSPVWDTAIAARALLAAGEPAGSDALRAAQGWLLDQQILAPGDWSQTVKAAPGGWCFEFANEPYPDVDDTSMVLMALSEARQAAQKETRDALLAAKRLSPAPVTVVHSLPATTEQETQGQTQFEAALRAEESLAASAIPKPRSRPWSMAGRAAQAAAAGVTAVREKAPSLNLARWKVRRLVSKQAMEVAIERAARVVGRGELPATDDLAAVPDIAQGEAAPRAESAIAKGEAWMLAMQNSDGGWGAFDRNNNRQFLCRIPFADHNAMIDPSSPDITARVLESLAALGRAPSMPAIQRGLAYIRKHQEPDGSWFGRWGVNYIYGTWQVLVGLAAVNVPAHDPAMRAGACWLLSCQQPCGGWGETPRSYDEPALKGQGPVTASQTAWAVLGLIAAGRHDSPAARRGIEYLLTTQNEDGTWDEAEFTGTGFPRVFYLKYHYYRIYFPLMALARYAQE